MLYLFEIEEETGVLASFGEVGEKHRDADEQHRGVLAHLPQRLRGRDKQTGGKQPIKPDAQLLTSYVASHCSRSAL